MDLKEQDDFWDLLSKFEPNRPVVFFNHVSLSCSIKILLHHQDSYKIPKSFLAVARESEEKIQCAAISMDQLTTLGASSIEQDQFSKGEPIFIWPKTIPHREPRARGGQAYDDIEKGIQDALAVTTYVVVEKIRQLLKIRDKRSRITTEAARNAVIKSLSQNWPANTIYSTIDSRYCHLWKLFNDGQRSKNWKSLFECDDLRGEIKLWSARFDKSSRNDIDQEVSTQKYFIYGLLACEIRAAINRKTISEVSDQAAKNIRLSIAQHAELAGLTTSNRTGVLDILTAAFFSNVNPVDIYPNLENVHTDFETMGLLGRLDRGLSAKFDHNNIVTLLSAFKLLEPDSKANEIKSPEELFWETTMTRIMDADSWYKFIRRAYSDTKLGKSVSLTIKWDNSGIF